jgi:hypothetical protein
LLFIVAGLLGACGPSSTNPGSDPGDDSDEPWPTVPQAPQPEVVLDNLSSPCGLAVTGDEMIVADKGSGRLLRVGLSTDGDATDVVSGLSAPTFVASSGSDLVVVDEGAGTIFRVRDGVLTPLATNQVHPTRVRVANDLVYWIVQGDQPDTGALRRVSIDGGSVTELASGLADPSGLSLTSTRAYFTEPTSKKIAFVPLAGGSITRGTNPYGATPFDVLVDEAAGKVFFSSAGVSGGGLIHRADTELTSAQIVAYSPSLPAWLLFNGEDVLWSTVYGISTAPRTATGADYDDVVAYASSCDFVVADGALYYSDPVTGRVLRQAL